MIILRGCSSVCVIDSGCLALSIDITCSLSLALILSLITLALSLSPSGTPLVYFVWNLRKGHIFISSCKNNTK